MSEQTNAAFDALVLNRTEMSASTKQASLHDYETGAEEYVFMRGIVRGLMDLEEGREVSLSKVKNILGGRNPVKKVRG